MNRRLHIQRQKFSREFKIEVVKLVTERGLAVAQAEGFLACDIGCA